jgi:flagellar motility protein MotE (MotC chaperone)
MKSTAHNRRRTAPAIGTTMLCLVVLGATPASTQSPDRIAPAAINDEIERFCGNIADAARDRRYVMQRQELEALKGEIDTRVQALEAKRAEYEHWMKLRQDFIQMATDNVVGIYARMRPDAAAERLATLDPELAAAIMMKLELKQSGQIMNEMNREAAAKLTVIMAASARAEDPT